MTGRRYFGQQQVVDLLSYLRLLQNRYDDEALLTVLASPFVGVSNDALVLIRSTAERRPIFKGIERTLPPDLADDDRRLVRAFLQRYERLVESSTRLSLELLCERILVEHDYDLAVLARRDGQRRYANLRKLARLAGRTRSSAAPTSRGSSGSSPSRRRPARASATRSRRRRAPTPCGCSRSTPPRGSSSRSSSSRTQGASGRASTRSSASPTAASASRSRIPRTGSRVGTTSYQDVKETRDARRRRSGFASTTSR